MNRDSRSFRSLIGMIFGQKKGSGDGCASRQSGAPNKKVSTRDTQTVTPKADKARAVVKSEAGHGQRAGVVLKRSENANRECEAKQPAGGEQRARESTKRGSKAPKGRSNTFQALQLVCTTGCCPRLLKASRAIAVSSTCGAMGIHRRRRYPHSILRQGRHDRKASGCRNRRVQGCAQDHRKSKGLA